MTLLQVTDGWNPPHGIWAKPFDGWGYVENIDGELADAFEMRITEAGVDIGDGILGWRGVVSSTDHKYANMPFELTPRHTEWTGIVVLDVRRGQDLAFSGMAETRGLECPWK